MKPITLAWEEIDTWLTDHAPEILQVLPSQVSAEDLVAVESTIGSELPTQMVHSLSAHDGSGGVWLHEFGAFLSARDIIKAWVLLTDLWADGNNDNWAKPKGPIRTHWWNRAWIPMIGDWSGNYLFLDLAPGPGGVSGQVVHWLNSGGPQQVLATSLSSLLSRFSENLQAGMYECKTNRGGGPYLDYVGPAA